MESLDLEDFQYNQVNITAFRYAQSYKVARYFIEETSVPDPLHFGVDPDLDPQIHASN